MDWYTITKITNIAYYYFTLIFGVASIVTILVTVFKCSSKASRKRRIIRITSLIVANIILLSFILPFRTFAKVSKESTENFNHVDYSSVFNYAKANGIGFSDTFYGSSCSFDIDGTDVYLQFNKQSDFNKAMADHSYMCFDIWDKIFSIRRFGDGRVILYLPTERDSDTEEIPMNKYVHNSIILLTPDGDVQVSYHMTKNSRDTLKIVSAALRQMSDGRYKPQKN